MRVFERDIKTKGEAQQYAIEWQSWQSEQNLCCDITASAEWWFYFSELAKKFDLTEEFKENGII